MQPAFVGNEVMTLRCWTMVPVFVVVIVELVVSSVRCCLWEPVVVVVVVVVAVELLEECGSIRLSFVVAPVAAENR